MAFDLITKFEGFHEKKYFDVVRYSIWYWQPANWKEYITQEEASKFVYDKIESIRAKWGLHKYNDNIEVWLISFIYNLWSPPSWYSRYIENHQLKALKNKMLEYSYAKWKFLRWLYKRRVAESNFIY